MMNIDVLDRHSILSESIFDEIFEEQNVIERTRMINSLREKAKGLGVKTDFEQLLSAYKKVEKEMVRATKRIEQPANDNITHFGDGKPCLNCGCWTADDYGIRTNTVFGLQVACPHPIFPLQILVNAETGLCKVRLAYKIRGIWREITVDRDTISSSSKIVGLSSYGIMVTSENAKALVRYLSDIESLNEFEIQEQVSTSKLGWINGEFMPYGRDIVFDNETNLKTAFESIRKHGSSDAWYELVKKLRSAGKFETMIYLAASFGSILVGPVNALPFVVNLWGESGKGKTVALMLAASVWADPSEGRFMADAKSTSTALEIKLDFLNNLPMMLDDMAQVKSQYDGDFSSLVYYWCSGKGKERSNKNLGLNKATCWANIILTNAERSLITETMQGGAINRIIDVEMGDGYIYENGNEIVRILKDNYGYAGFEFVKVVQQLGFDRIREIQEEQYKKLVDHSKLVGAEKEEKQLLPMSILLTADLLMEEYIFQDGQNIDFQKCFSILRDKGEISENERCYEYIMDEVSLNQSRFLPYVPDNAPECWGTVEQNYIYINKNVFNRMCAKAGFSERTFLAWAKKIGIIKCDGGHNTIMKRFGNSPSCRCVCIMRDWSPEPIEVPEEFKLTF